MEGTKVYPGQCDKAFPEVYTQIPEQPKEKKPGQLSEHQIKTFFEQGFVVVDNFFNTETELEPVKKDLESFVDNLAQKLYKAGKISNLFENESLSTRLIRLEEAYPGSTILFHKLGRQTQAIWDLWCNDRLLNVMEQLLGTSDIQGNPVWNIRPKTPGNEATTVPWHQDSGYMETETYSVLTVTAWIPFINTTKSNGCMEMIPGAHRKGKVATHTGVWEDTWYIMLDENEIEQSLDVDVKKDAKYCEVPYGGMVLFNNLVPHRSPSNTSNEIRWSIDLRWQRADTPVGFYGLKPGVVMRKSEDPTFKSSYPPETSRAMSEQSAADEVDDLNTVIAGPWIKRWELVNTNRHSDAAMKLF